MPDKASFYEYTLFASIILLSGMGVASLPSYLDETPVSPVNAYTAAMYVAFLGWAFHELHFLHAKKSPERMRPRPMLVVDIENTVERAMHSDDPEVLWSNRLSVLQRWTVRFLEVLGGKIVPIERAVEDHETRVQQEPREKPEAA